VIVVVSDAALHRLLSSDRLIASSWPHDGEDVCVLVKLLQVTFPSLAEVLSLGLVDLAGVNQSEVTLAHRQASVRALALSQAGHEVPDPKQHPHAVLQLDIIDLKASGCSAAKVAR